MEDVSADTPKPSAINGYFSLEGNIIFPGT